MCRLDAFFFFPLWICMLRFILILDDKSRCVSLDSLLIWMGLYQRVRSCWDLRIARLGRRDLIQWDHWIYSNSNLIFYPMIQVFRWILFYLIWPCIFMFFVFLEERDIKVEQNYIFNIVFNKGGLWKSNKANLR